MPRFRYVPTQQSGGSQAIAPAVLDDFSTTRSWAPGRNASGVRLTHDGTTPIWTAATDIFPDQVMTVDAQNRLKIAVGSLSTSLYPAGSGTITAVAVGQWTDSSQTWGANQFAPSANSGYPWVQFSNGAYGSCTGNPSSTTATYGALVGTPPSVGMTYRVTYNARLYIQFLALGSIDLYSFPYSYLQYYLVDGRWSPYFNRFSWYQKCDTTGPAVPISPPSDAYMTCKGYPKAHSDPDTSGASGGDGLYCTIQCRVFANCWTKVVMTPQTTTAAGHSGSFQVIYDAEAQIANYTSAGVAGNYPNIYGNGSVLQHWFDSLERWWIELVNLPGNGVFSFDVSNWWFDDFSFSYDSAEPMQLFSNSCVPPIPVACAYGVTVTYNPSLGQYFVDWNSPKHVSQSYNVYYSSVSMRAAGDCTTGTLAATAASLNSDFTWCSISFTLAALPRIYIAIQRQGDPNSVFFETDYINRTD